MAWADALDRCNRACRDTYPARVVYDPDGAALALTAIFDEAFEQMTTDAEGYPVTSVSAALSLRLLDLTSEPRSHDILTIQTALPGGTYGPAARYEVTQVQRDGGGMATLILTEA